ncbi:ABC transporter permease [Micromonospora ureilytica]|uniref:ABC transporter permease n=1 Tax=Micromonospora ureilytica TaxID=709868 RepID=UPI00403A518B
MIRALAIDLRRSAAVGTGLIVLLLGLAAMYLLFGQDAWSSRWSPLATTLRTALAFTWPLTLAAGAWLTDRDRRGRVGELFTSTARPARQRAASPALALSLTVTVAYLLTVAACLPLVAGSATYFNPAAIAVIATGLPLLLAAGLLGMGLGAVVPSRFTAPTLAMAGLILSSATGLLSAYSVAGPIQQSVALLSPVLGQSGDFLIVPARLSLAQLIWALALATTGFLLLSATNVRARTAAALPAVFGAVTALLLLVSAGPANSMDAVDAGARELVCADGTPRVCVRRVHAAILPDTVAPARDALHRLSRLPNPPTAVEEGIQDISGNPDEQDTPSGQTITFYIEIGQAADIDAGQVTQQLLTGAGVISCGDTSNSETYDAARLAAAYWLLQTPPPDTKQKVVEAWQRLTSLPAAEQLARIAALRNAGLACNAEAQWDILMGGPR